jgi:hypothetical protein
MNITLAEGAPCAEKTVKATTSLNIRNKDIVSEKIEKENVDKKDDKPNQKKPIPPLRVAAPVGLKNRFQL